MGWEDKVVEFLSKPTELLVQYKDMLIVTLGALWVIVSKWVSTEKA